MSANRPALRGVSGDPGDPLERRKRFEARHPEIVISAPGLGDPWWTARRDGQHLASAYMLGRLMDNLDRLTGEQT